VLFDLDIAIHERIPAARAKLCPLSIRRVLKLFVNISFGLHVCSSAIGAFVSFPLCNRRSYNNAMPRLPLKIRDYQDGDLETLCEIDRICFPSDIAFTRAEFVLHLTHPKSITRVGEGVGGILGFAMAQKEMQSCAHIITLDVIPSARHQNIATSLMETSTECLKGKE